MGRSRKYLTEEDRREARRAADKKWREKNPKRARKLAAARALKWHYAHHEKNKKMMRERANARWKKMSKDERRDKKLRETYGLTLIEWRAMFVAQGKGCAICGSKTPHGQKVWHTDHCHRTGKVRGILCKYCNTALGLARERVDIIYAWARYLINHS